ncbi:NACHT, LRR and PYD domains-containing protein 3-like [Stegostoma tigrinum]|uniref:NACHT, LRR and PYD domains-containing protein 3-like n=1 Tax=Stegostoma tigrinum TaxID=3053191 RepID=UPI00202AF15F|nr:NACHT, LRR and PYD domains-containing protein 3-like [Stegostoma tigrinum]
MAAGHRIKNNLSVSSGGKVFAPNIQSDKSSGPLNISMGNKTIVNHYGGAYEKKLSGTDLKKLKVIHKKKSEEAVEYLIETEKKGKKRVLLRERFINVRITEGDSSENAKEKSEERVIEYRDIFSPVSGQSREPLTVVTKGLAGIGKSVLVQKLIYDWATGAALSEYDFIFSFPFRELSLLSTVKQEISLPDLVKQYYPYIEKCASLLANESIRMLFIFDGLSDGDLEVDFNKHIVYRDVTGAIALGALLVNLIKKELIPTASIWITTRPGTKNSIPAHNISRVTEITGFRDQEKEDYFRRRCEDQALTQRMLQVMKKQRNLFFMCTVPAFCSILFSVLETVLDAQDEIPQTLTEVYSHFLVHLILFQEEKLEVVNKDTQVRSLKSKHDSILALGKLSFEKSNIKGCDTVLFSEEELKQNNIELSLVCGGLCKEIADGSKSNYSFVHLAVQEYFAALYVFLAFYNQKKNVLGKSFKLFEKQSYSQICKEACASAIKDGKGRQEFFLRFLCGLGTAKSQQFLEGLLASDGKNKERDDSKKIAKFLKKTLQANIPPEQTIDILHCLNELNDTSALEEIKAAFKSGNFSSGSLSPAQCSALAFVLQMSEESYQELDLSMYKLPSIGIRRLLLTANYFTGIKLSGANIRDCGVKILTDVMRSQDCKLQNVKLDGNNLTHKSCEHLATALADNHKIILLDLSDNNIQDKGFILLCKALEAQKCSLQMLSVGGNKLTSACCKDLAKMLGVNNTLVELDLSHNRIGENGLQELSEALKNESCKLQKLGLNSIFAFEFGIMGTYEDASGAGIICDILKSKNCTLQSLGLAKNSFTENGCAELIKSLKGNQILTELDLGSNNVQNEGMAALCDILTEKGCKIQSLKVANAKLTSDCCARLASVFNTNQTLTELDVSMNELGNDGVTMLLSSLKDSRCKLQKLGLSKTNLTDAWSIDLKATFATLQELVELDLSHNKFTDKSVQRFSEFILHCVKIKTVRLEKNRFSAKEYKTLEDLKKIQD